MLPRNLNVIMIAVVISLICYSTVARARKAILVGEAISLIDQYYVDPVNDADLVEAAMTGMTSTLDEHSEFIPPRMYGMFQDVIDQEFAGIGILVEQPEPANPVRIITPLVGSPALAAGLLPGDEIMKVNDDDVSKMEIGEVSNLLRGPIGTQVTITVQRQTETAAKTETETAAKTAAKTETAAKQSDVLDIVLTRETIALESVVGDHRNQDNQWVFHLRQYPEIAYVRLTSFGEKTVSEFKNIIRSLPDPTESLIIDVRANAGGLLQSAVEVCDDFLESGRIVTIKKRGGEIDSEYDATPGVLVKPELRVVVLIDGNSASASEIVAACLQDHARATIVGSRSFGKGTVQNVLSLDYGRSALKLTTARYYRPNGRNIHRMKDSTPADEWGVSPDKGMAVPIDEEGYKKLIRVWQRASFPVLAPLEADLPASEVEDAQLKRAVEFLKPTNPETAAPQTARQAA